MPRPLYYYVATAYIIALIVVVAWVVADLVVEAFHRWTRRK